MASSDNTPNMLLEDSNYNNDETVAPQKGAIAAFFSNVDVLRQISMIIGLLIVLAIVVIIWSWGKEADYRPLGTYQTEELITTLDFLDKQQIQYKLEGNSILVISEQYQKIKLQMTRAGLVNDNSEDGDDILLQDMGFGVSQRVEKERLKLSRERQLALAIQEMKSVTNAKVLLAIPKESVFARKEREASATVVVTTARSYTLSSQEVDSIVDIVASAVQGLSPNNVTVSDQRGRLLHSGSSSGMSAQSSKEFALQREREDEYKAKIDAILIPVLGLANYTSEVDLMMDFTVVEETKKTFNPTQQAVRSEMLVETKSTSALAGSVPGALSNQPPATSSIPEEVAGNESAKTVDGNSHNETTRNFEVDSTVTYIKHKIGKVDRLAVSVALDYVTTTNEAGDVVYTPRPAEEIANIRRLLLGGLGINVARGDVLEIASVSFNRPELASDAEEEFWKTEIFQSYVRFGGSMLIILLTLLLIVRPIMKKLLYPEMLEKVDEYELGGAIGSMSGNDLQLLNDDDNGIEFGITNGQVVLPDLHKDEDLLKAVRALVANEPGLSAQVIKEWLIKDDG
ncbi:flagellar basal-body MS-ring/collar protein FliF [Psychromonas sp. MME2]|uniref:flagellar basal-body MS-ring/collar protein FliF n=1 Tax=unclassified Psychromonas TaxID=2614957 RepID=UPI00339C4C73